MMSKKIMKTMDRNRPYDGQPHTSYGGAGKKEIQGLTMRDVCDCYVRGVILSAGVDNPKLYEEAMKGEAACLSPTDLSKIKGLVV